LLQNGLFLPYGFYLFLVTISLSCKYTSTTSGGTNEGDPWQMAHLILEKIKDPVFPDKDVLITEFGAKGDGLSDCSVFVDITR
jgi:hypothetical protein